MENKSLLYSGLVWIVAAVALTTYGMMGVLGYKVPGVEELVGWLSRVDGWWILLAAFLSIFIEGLYFVGSFFPGSTLVVIVSVLSQTQGWHMFAFTILSIFIGWVVAGVVNIVFAIMYRNSLKQTVREDFVVKDRPWVTWFPAFRSNYEVAQIVSGGDPVKVFFSSVRVKVWGSLAATLHVATLPLFIDIKELKNEEGFVTLFVVAAITFIVGVWQVRKYLNSEKTKAYATSSLH